MTLCWRCHGNTNKIVLNGELSLKLHPLYMSSHIYAVVVLPHPGRGNSGFRRRAVCTSPCRDSCDPPGGFIKEVSFTAGNINAHFTSHSLGGNLTSRHDTNCTGVDTSGTRERGTGGAERGGRGLVGFCLFLHSFQSAQSIWSPPKTFIFILSCYVFHLLPHYKVKLQFWQRSSSRENAFIQKEVIKG